MADLWDVTENDWECYDLGISYKFIYNEVGFKLINKNKLNLRLYYTKFKFACKNE
jgi:hypothetical protein